MPETTEMRIDRDKLFDRIQRDAAAGYSGNEGADVPQTTRDVLMAEVDFLLDCAKAQADVGIACEMALAAQKRLDAVKAIDRLMCHVDDLVRSMKA